MKNLKSKIIEGVKVIPLVILWLLIIYSGYSAITKGTPFILWHYVALLFLIVTTIFYIKKPSVGKILLLVVLVLAAINLLQFLPQTIGLYSSTTVYLGPLEYSDKPTYFSPGLNPTMLLLLFVAVLLNLKSILRWFKK